uniref:RING-type domain-containing protein n=1 Tax=Panagrellus redivivus TaxID=6233 RepID=A0A7E4VN81_PANRE
MSGASTPHYNFNGINGGAQPIPLLQLGFNGRPPPAPSSGIKAGYNHGPHPPPLPAHYGSYMSSFPAHVPNTARQPLQPLMAAGNGSNRPRCAVCNDILAVEQSTRLGCGHRLCPICILSSPSHERCQNCAPMPSLLANRHIRDAFNRQSPSVYAPNRPPQQVMNSGSSSVDGSPSVQFGALGSRDSTFSIWEPLPLGDSADVAPDMSKPPPAIPQYARQEQPDYNAVYASTPSHYSAASGTSTPTTAIQTQPKDFHGEALNVELNKKMGTKCTNCFENPSVVIGHCMNCNEFLCGTCIMAHARVKITRDHKIRAIGEGFRQGPGDSPNQLRLQTSSEPPSLKADSESPNSCAGGSTVSTLSACPDHDLFFVAHCATCGGATLCVRCLQSHAGHSVRPLITFDMSQALRRLVNESRNVQQAYDDSQVAVHRMAERLDQALATVQNQTKAAIAIHLDAIHKRQNELTSHIESIHRVKMSTLREQSEMLKRKRVQLNEVIGHATALLKDASMPSGGSSNGSSLTDDHDPRILECYDAILRIHAETFVPLVPTTNDALKLKLPANDTVLQAIRSFGQIESGMCPKASTLIGNGFKRAIAGRPYAVSMQMKDICGDIVTKECREQGGEFVATLFGPLNGGGASIQHAEIIDRDGGICTLMFNPKQVGMYRLNVTYCQMSITGTPTEVIVSAGRDYRDAQSQGQKFCFGKEGEGDGEFSRPWGICCDSKGRIIVADRSNHRIQIFDPFGKFIMKFGAKGVFPGFFNRPAGVCTNTMDEIVVADKDNHRVQVFTKNGVANYSFGTRGCKTGMFNYPWGVATNSANEIAVTDTRNHRVQIFTRQGHPLRVCLVDAGVKRFSGLPRGICFLPDGDLLITDFNTHRLAVVNGAGETKFFGCEGQLPGSFHRPQGIAVDPDGLVLVCDSRCHRVQVLNLYDLSIVAIFGGEKALTEKGIPATLEPEKLLDTVLFRPADPMFYTTPTTPVEDSDELLDNPTDCCVSPEGLVYVVDFKNNCVRVF